MQEHKINSIDNLFIAGWYFDDTNVCDSIIQWFSNIDPITGHKMPVKDWDGGLTATYSACDKEQFCYKPYLAQLSTVFHYYIKKFPWSDMYAPSSLEQQKFNVQHYAPNEGFTRWHTERTGQPENSFRHLVFMTYLNDVTDGGETEFVHQKIKVKPEKGLTLVWPADWTHTHRGIPSPSENKYIATGWLRYDPPTCNSY
jgi:hypothetical protein